MKKHMRNNEAVENDIFDQTFGGETCTVCQVKCKSVSFLQEHILTKHCQQMNGLNELLKMQQQLLNTILANQATQEKSMNEIYTKQICIIGDITDIKKVVVNEHNRRGHNGITPPPLLSPNPPVVPLPCPPSYANMTGSLAPAAVPPVRSQAPTVPPARIQAPSASPATEVKTIAYITDSIGGNVYIKELEQLTKAKFRTAKAYGSTRRSKEEGFKFPDRNFTDVVPAVLAASNVDVAVTMAPSVELSNLPADVNDEYAAQEASNSSYNMVKVAENALASNPNLKMFVIAERVPRYDKLHNLNKYANNKLFEAANAVKNQQVKNRIFIGKHNLDSTLDGLRLSRFGDPRRVKVDGIHMKGSSGKVSFSRSLANILAKAGLCDSKAAEQLCRSEEQYDSYSTEFQRVQNGRRAAAPTRREGVQFELRTENRFAVLGN